MGRTQNKLVKELPFNAYFEHIVSSADFGQVVEAWFCRQVVATSPTSGRASVAFKLEQTNKHQRAEEKNKR